MEIIGVIAGVAAFIAFLVFVLPWLFKLKAKYLEKALAEYSRNHGVKVKLIKTGIPPIKYWLGNRKGDCWGLVEFEDGSQKWVRYGTRLIGEPMRFYD